jgi:hypothetical protein
MPPPWLRKVEHAAGVRHLIAVAGLAISDEQLRQN